MATKTHIKATPVKPGPTLCEAYKFLLDLAGDERFKAWLGGEPHIAWIQGIPNSPTVLVHYGQLLNEHGWNITRRDANLVNTAWRFKLEYRRTPPQDA